VDQNVMISSSDSILDEHMYDIYGWVLERGYFDDGQAAEDLGVDQKEVVKAFERLILLGLIRVDPRNRRRARAVDPDAASVRHVLPLHHTIRREQEKLDRLTLDFTRLRERFLNPARLLDPSGNRCQPFKVIPDLDEVRAALNRAAAECRQEMLTMQPGGNRAPEALEEARARDHALLSRGVTMRTLYHHTARFNGPSLAYMDEAVSRGAEYRTAHELVGRLVLFDRTRMAFIPMADDEDGAVCISEPSVVAYLRKVFEMLWMRATPVTGAAAADPGQVAKELDGTILRLLAAGLKDEAIARRVGMSLRTTRRHIADIMNQLGAESRFQAGVLAARAGGGLI